MTAVKQTKAGSITTVFGRGGIGGKGEGLVTLDQINVVGARKLTSQILATEFYDRFRDNGDGFDAEVIEVLRRVHASFARAPIGVRSSEKYEDDPLVATSGASSSYMLPNNHRQQERRFSQFLLAIRQIFERFTRRTAEAPALDNDLALVVNPVPGIASNTSAGSFYHPMSSGVADSFFKHPLTLQDGTQDPNEGFARLAFGHGYAVVLDMFEVVPMATIARPLDPALLTRSGQQYYYAIQLHDNPVISDEEMLTMSMLHMRFAHPEAIAAFQDAKGRVNFDRLIRDDEFKYRSQLTSIMNQLEGHSSNFQIEFTWNLFDKRGTFHVVQLKRLRDANRASVVVPQEDDDTMVSTDQFQGHGSIEGIRHAIVINPFAYRPEQHAEVVGELERLNAQLGEQGERYILVCPGRLGTTNRQWGFWVEFKCVSNAAVIVEYGFDVKGSPTIAVTADEMTGGVYGSHFLYQILGGANEAERARRVRMFGSQGTHFLTNLYTSGILYLCVNPISHHLSRWFFTFPEGKENAPIYVKETERPLNAYANLFEKRCVVCEARAPRPSTAPESRRPMMRIINPHKIDQALVCATHDEIRRAGQRLNTFLPSCTVTTLSDPSQLNRPHADKTFVLFIDEGAMPFFDRREFNRHNPAGTVIMLSYDLKVGSAPTKAELERVCPLASRADQVFYVDDAYCHPSLVMPAALRHAEDAHNIAYHKRARRFIFLVVDDELRWFSQFLPVLYRVIGQRAAVMTARTYEDAQAIMAEYRSDVVCLITDMVFPMGDTVSADAGRELVISTKRDCPRIPIIIASKAEQGEELRDHALILPKGEPGATDTLDRYVHDCCGFGDFLFVHEGKPWARASTLADLRDIIAVAPLDMLEEYAANDYFSTWLYMHSFRNLGDTLRRRGDRGEELRGLLLSNIEHELAIVEEQDLVLSSATGEVLGQASTVEELARLIGEVDSAVLRTYAVEDLISTWLTRKGHSELADAIRPIHGEGEELRAALLDTIGQWIAR